MDKILNRIYSIENHPISKLNIDLRIKYIKGLGACLYELSHNSHITRNIYYAWADSIIGNKSTLNDFWKRDIKAVKSAISIQRQGILFFSMKYSFFFDIFYLLEHSFLPQYQEAETYIFLRENVSGLFTSRALEKLYSYYKFGVKPKRVDNLLLEHRNYNNSNLKEKEKRILVLANVSAGKSTLINSLIGYRINKTKTTACTNKIVKIHNKCRKNGCKLKFANKTFGYTSNINEVSSEDFIEASFPFNSSLSNEHICFIDTPGINNANDLKHQEITKEIVAKDEYDVVIYISNSLYFGTNDENNFLKYLKCNVKKPIIFVLNQLDNFVKEEDSIVKMLNDYKSELSMLGFKNTIIVPLSAYASFLFRLDPSQLTKIEVRKLKMFNEVFGDDYYDLPVYIGEQKSKDKLSMTGIEYLEHIIKFI